MKMQMYYQKIRIDAEGRKIFIGEDALPYADKKLLVVADGLGGRGGYPHTKVSSQILNKDSFYDFAFAHVFEVEPSYEFKDYVIKSFSEVFESKDYYFTNAETMRSSGYFASRIASIIAVYLVKYDQEFLADSLFESVNGALNEQKTQIINDYCLRFGAVLKQKISAVAQKLNLTLESNLTGSYLLPTTLQMALVDEKQDSLNVIYLWAGDSRAYVWEKSGLKQITQDHERGETMTNLITLTKPFAIEGRLVEAIAKPCILFNASDGCYKCPVFASPFDLEYIFLDAIKENVNFQNVAKALAGVFKSIGVHDDSNTMALASYGYDNFIGVQADVLERLNNIKKTYLARLPGILEIDYNYECEKCANSVIEALSNDVGYINANQSELNHVVYDMVSEGYEPMLLEFEKYLLSSAVKKSESFKLPKDSMKDSFIYYIKLTTEKINQDLSNARKEILGFINQNWNTGAKFSEIGATGELTKDGEKVTSDRLFVDMIVEVFSKIRKGKITLKEGCVCYGENKILIDSETYQKVSEQIAVMLNAGANLQLMRASKKIALACANEYYLKNGVKYATNIFNKEDVLVASYCGDEVKQAVSELKTARSGLKIREEIYAEYQVEYEKYYEGSKLL